MTFDRINRRTHLYLAMFLMPWFFMYGISALPFSHSDFFNAMYDDGNPNWIPRAEKEYKGPLPADQEGDREIGAQILKEFGISGVAFGTYRPNPRTMFVYMPGFLGPTQITYTADENHLVLQDKRFRLDHILTSMHARGGYGQDVFLDDLWAFLVDVVMVSILIWIASGIYMWWHIRSVRFWGVVSLAGGFLSFFILLVGI